jgi:hypothetical protein
MRTRRFCFGKNKSFSRHYKVCKSSACRRVIISKLLCSPCPTCCENAPIFCAQSCISSTIFALFTYFKWYFIRQKKCIITAILCVLEPRNSVYRVKIQYLFHAIRLTWHRLQHMCRNFLPRLVQEHGTLPEHHTICCENAPIFCAPSCISSTIFAFFTYFKWHFI